MTMTRTATLARWGTEPSEPVAPSAAAARGGRGEGVGWGVGGGRSRRGGLGHDPGAELQNIFLQILLDTAMMASSAQSAPPVGEAELGLGRSDGESARAHGAAPRRCGKRPDEGIRHSAARRSPARHTAARPEPHGTRPHGTQHSAARHSAAGVHCSARGLFWGAGASHGDVPDGRDPARLVAGCEREGSGYDISYCPLSGPGPGRASDGLQPAPLPPSDKDTEVEKLC